MPLERFRQRDALLLLTSLLLSLGWAPPLFAQPAGQGGGRTQAGPTISHRTAQVNGVKYHYALSGSGPTTVVLLHGWPVTWYHWHTIIPALAAQYSVVAPDLRGLGLTERPDSGHDKRTVAEDIYQLIRHLGSERVYLVGHDIGGMVAFALAHEHPEAVQKLVILDAPIPGLGIWEQSQRRLWHHVSPGP